MIVGDVFQLIVLSTCFNEDKIPDIVNVGKMMTYYFHNENESTFFIKIMNIPKLYVLRTMYYTTIMCKLSEISGLWK